MGQVANKLLDGVDRYPQGFNERVHGSYNPGRYYGPEDTKFTQTKVGDLTKWIGRRNMGAQSTLDLFKRAHHRYRMKWFLCKKPKAAFLFQFIGFMMLVNYIDKYPNHIKYQAHAKYH